MKNRTTKSSKGQIWGCARLWAPAVYLLFACCPHHVCGKPHGHARCQQWPMHVCTGSHWPCKTQKGPWATCNAPTQPFLTLCQQCPGGPKLLLSLFLKFATSQVAQNPQEHDSGATTNHTSTNCGHWGTKSTHGGHALPCLNFF